MGGTGNLGFEKKAMKLVRISSDPILLLCAMLNLNKNSQLLIIAQQTLYNKKCYPLAAF